MNLPTRHMILLAAAIAAWQPDVAAQTSATDISRQQISRELRRGHQRIGYKATWNALQRIYVDPATSSHLMLFYTGRSQDIRERVNSDPHDGWNREHLWPQSRGARQEPMKSDLHHLKPSDASVNQKRSNLLFGIGGKPEGEASDTFLTAFTFEPRDDVKGDVARAIFYMDLRYEGRNGEPDLQLKTGSINRDTSFGGLCTLLSWHKADPADADERRRNDLIETIQGNRNLFIDRPALAEALFGAQCNGNTALEVENTTKADATSQNANRIRLVAWNIANFWPVAGEFLRPRRDGSAGQIRTAVHYKNIEDVIEDLDGDIYALQEMASPKAVERLFPKTDWTIVFSYRFYDDLADDPSKLDDPAKRDIYTALALRRSKVKVIATERIELDLMHDGRPTREGIAAKVETNGEVFWVASVHLKSRCFADNDLTSSSDCRTLAKQIPILEEWLDEKSSSGKAVAVMGDFNRQLDRREDIVIDDLDDQEPVDIYRIPFHQKSICTAFRSGKQTSIDYILLNEKLWELVRAPREPKVDIATRDVSDHCPVFTDLIVTP